MTDTIQPELAARLLDVARAIDNVLVAGPRAAPLAATGPSAVPPG